MSLEEFLLARLRADWAYALGNTDLSEQDPVYEFAKIAARQIIKSVEAQRRIVNLDDHGHGDSAYLDGWNDAAEWAIKELASVYADHPDYRDEWRLQDLESHTR